MNYGMQISTSGVLNAMYRQDVVTNNLANLSTTGFKPDVAESRQRDAMRLEDGLAFIDSNQLLERLGAGVTNAPNRIVFKQGPLQETGNSLDLAIQRDGFFTVPGDNGQGVRLTRDGRLTLDGNGRLVQAASGTPVLNEQGQPIDLDPGRTVQIDGDGVISQGGRPVDRLHFVEPFDPATLRKAGAGQYDVPGGAQSLRPATGQIVQGSIEGSAVNEVKALMDIQAASRAVSSNIGMISYQDRMLDLAINRFGRIA